MKTHMTKRLVFVTGGSKGIGENIVRRLAKAKFPVAFSYYNGAAEAKKIQQELSLENLDVFCVQMQLEDRNSIMKAMNEARQHFSLPISILVNNASISQEKDFLSITDDEWDTMLNTNLRGYFICSQLVIPEMENSNWGRVINVSSIGGQWGGKNQVHYAASKAAQINLSHSLSNLYAKSGITSNTVAVGLAKTGMTESELSSAAGINKVSNIPLGRIAELDEISNTVLFLCSDESSYITGQTLNLNGGMLNS